MLNLFAPWKKDSKSLPFLPTLNTHLLQTLSVLSTLLGAMCIPPFNLHNIQKDNSVSRTVQMRELRLRKVKHLAQHHTTRKLCDLRQVTQPTFVSPFILENG